MQLVLFKLSEYGLTVVANSGKMVHCAGDYTIEIENDHLFKLLQGGQVIAPFADLDELCQFIKMDIQLNENG